MSGNRCTHVSKNNRKQSRRQRKTQTTNSNRRTEENVAVFVCVGVIYTFRKYFMFA